MIQSLAIGGTSPAKRQMKDDEEVGELSMCESPKRKRIQVETKSEPVSTLSAKAWAFSIDAIITPAADHPTTSSETSDSEDWPQNEDELKPDPGFPVSTVNETNEHQRGGPWSHQTPASRAASSPTQTPTLAEPAVGRPVESRFVDVQRLWTRRDCDTPPLKLIPRKDSDPRAADSRCAFLGAANPLPPHNPPEGRTESLKGSPSLCRVSRGTGDLARVRCQLETRDLWTKFNELGTEMIITKSGRRMFPVVRISFTGLKPTTKYLVLMDIVPVDSKRYRYAYHRSSWLVAGKADPDVQQRCYVHPDAPFLGEQLSKQAVSFEKLKLTNNVMDKHGYIILNSMHKYQPRIHLIKRSAVEPFMATPPQSLSSIRSDEIKTFEFPETVFIAVTAYQNQLITKLKIDCNPFAKGFRDSARLSDFERESMETLLATHTGSGGVIGTLSNQFRAYVPGGERRAGLEEEGTEEDVPSPKRALTLPSLHPSVLHQLAEVLTSSSKMHALYRKPSDGEELVKRLLSLQRYYQQKQEPGTQESPAGVSTANPSIQRVGLGKPVLAPVGGTFQPMDLSGTGTIRAREEEQHLTSHWPTPLRLPYLPPDMNPTSPAAAMLTYLQMVQQTHSPIGGLSGPTCLPGKPAASPHIGPGTHSTQAAVVSEAAIPFFENYRQLREDTARLVPTLTTSALMK